MTSQSAHPVPLLLSLNLLLPAGLIALAAYLGASAPLAARLAYLGATFAVFGLLVIERHGVATAVGFYTLGVSIFAEFWGLGPFGTRSFAVVTGLCWINTATLATRLMRDARARRS